jgi:hypothetical protein
LLGSSFFRLLRLGSGAFNPRSGFFFGLFSLECQRNLLVNKENGAKSVESEAAEAEEENGLVLKEHLEGVERTLLGLGIDGLGGASVLHGGA